MKKAVLIFAIIISTASLSFAQRHGGFIRMEVINGTRQPNPNEVRLMAIEETNHPNVAKSMHEVEKAMQHLNEAPDEFGGHKAQAQSDLRQAWISLRKALYFRIYQDTH
jgi:hypothetical protein